MFGFSMKKIPCEICQGTGVNPLYRGWDEECDKQCTNCYGTGKVAPAPPSKEKFSGERRRVKQCHCSACNGTGKINGMLKVSCQSCNGVGWISTSNAEESRCNNCEGAGEFPREVLCSPCSGKGEVEEYEYYRRCQKCNGYGSYHDVHEEWWERPGDYTGEMRIIDNGVKTCEHCSGEGGCWQ